MSAPDKYDEAIAMLTRGVHVSGSAAIRAAWENPLEDPAGCLFAFAAHDPRDGDTCGCLTQVRGEKYNAATPELTAAIRADTRIPRRGYEITLADLPVFAEWQRRLDRELSRS